MTASMGVAFADLYSSAAGKPTFELLNDEMELGGGIHGEPGKKRKNKICKSVTDEILETILEDLKPVIIKKYYYMLMVLEEHLLWNFIFYLMWPKTT